MKERLERQADHIEQVLTIHGAQARITGGMVTPRWIRFQAFPHISTKVSKIKALSEEMAAALDVPTCRIQRRGASVDIEIPRDDPKPVRLLPLYRQLVGYGRSPSCTAILGLSEDGSPLLIRFPSPDVAHVLISGTTGAGKTVLKQAMILSLALTNTPRQVQMVLIDPKRTAYRAFQHLPHTARYATEPEEILEVLRSLVYLMERRPMVGDNDPSVVVFIDELVDLLMVSEDEIRTQIVRLTQRGREAGIHVVAATQKPTASILGPLMKANFPVRMCGKVTSTTDARVATGWSGTGAERLMGKGDFVAVAEGRAIRFQAADVTQEEIESTLEERFGVKPRLAVPAVVDVEAKADQGDLLSSPDQPAPPSPPDPNLEKANLLIHSELWDGRKDGDGYRWGWWSAAAEFLFDQPYAGAFAKQTKEIVALAESIKVQQ